MTPLRKLRIALLRSDGPHHIYLEHLLAENFELVLTVEESGQAQLNRLWRNGRYVDWMWWSYRNLRRSILGLNRYRKQQFADVPADYQSAAIPTAWINAASVVAAVQAAAVDVTIVIGTSILKPALLHAAGDNVINIHGGFFALLSGQLLLLFALYDRRPDLTGSTIHFVDAGVDTGDIIERVPAGRMVTKALKFCIAERKSWQSID